MIPSLSPAVVQSLPNSALAYLGDSCYEHCLRRWLLTHVHAKSGALHRQGVRYSNARYQAVLARSWVEQGLLTEAERDVLMRGRNANPGTMAKHASPVDYRWATGAETLLGWLQLRGEEERMWALLLPFWEAVRQTPQGERNEKS